MAQGKKGTGARARTVRVPDELWKATKVEADRRNESVTDAVVRFLRQYTGSSESK